MTMFDQLLPVDVCQVILIHDLLLTFRLFEGGTLEIFTDSEGKPIIDTGKQ